MASTTCRPSKAADAAATWCDQGRVTPASRSAATTRGSAHEGQSTHTAPRAGSDATWVSGDSPGATPANTRPSKDPGATDDRGWTDVDTPPFSLPPLTKARRPSQ
ncbi:hypothetical protein GCM10023321_04520 [Pseudonocardia eucalypti]|uniref:Uncharacterized protein n=1 Tax=Pseudonocardia eucalypti TaxID=648755 RepID=A0ABP9PFU3_9PSEU